MLVLSRRVSQSIKIGNDVEVTVVKIEKDKVRIGITAPKTMPVNREEVIKKEKPAGLQHQPLKKFVN